MLQLLQLGPIDNGLTSPLLPRPVCHLRSRSLFPSSHVVIVCLSLLCAPIFSFWSRGVQWNLDVVKILDVGAERTD